MEAKKKKEIRERFNSLKDRGLSFYSVYDDSNVELWLEKILEGKYSDADKSLLLLESKDSELQQSNLKNKKKWERGLRQALSSAKITESGLLEALVKKVILNDSTLADDLKPVLEKLNTDHPRPQE